MAIESWIDTLCGLWEMDDLRGGTVKSYRYYDKSEMPESISVFPCAVTLTTTHDPNITAGQVHCITKGKTEFHLVSNVDKSKIPYCSLFIESIITQVAGNLKLGGLVDHFKLDPEVGRGKIVGPAPLAGYGSEEPHLGLIVYWEVKESYSVTVSA